MSGQSTVSEKFCKPDEQDQLEVSKGEREETTGEWEKSCSTPE